MANCKISGANEKAYCMELLPMCKDRRLTFRDGSSMTFGSEAACSNFAEYAGKNMYKSKPPPGSHPAPTPPPDPGATSPGGARPIPLPSHPAFGKCDQFKHVEARNECIKLMRHCTAPNGPYRIPRGSGRFVTYDHPGGCMSFVETIARGREYLLNAKRGRPKPKQKPRTKPKPKPTISNHIFKPNFQTTFPVYFDNAFDPKPGRNGEIVDKELDLPLFYDETLKRIRGTIIYRTTQSIGAPNIRTIRYRIFLDSMRVPEKFTDDMLTASFSYDARKTKPSGLAFAIELSEKGNFKGIKSIGIVKVGK